MKIEIFSIFTIFLLLISFPVLAQIPSPFCGTSSSENPQFVNIEDIRLSRQSLATSKTLKIFVHLTTNDNGTLQTINLDTVQERINDMRDQFSPHGICFILAGIEVIPNSDLDSQYVFPEESELLPYLKPGMINIFVHHFLKDGNIVGGGNAYDIPNAYLSVEESALAGACCKLILTHEMGHCLGLHHTHATVGGNENVARVGACKNCETVGDLLCDTPADPVLSITGMMSGCTYVGTVTDACASLYAPDPQNIMSAAPRDCWSNFTSGQGLRMQWHIDNISELNVAIVPPNITFSTTGSWSSGGHFYLAEQSVILNSADLSVVGSAQVTFGAGNHVTVFPGTEFKPQTGFTLLSAQNNCNN